MDIKPKYFQYLTKKNPGIVVPVLSLWTTPQAGTCAYFSKKNTNPSFLVTQGLPHENGLSVQKQILSSDASLTSWMAVLCYSDPEGICHKFQIEDNNHLEFRAVTLKTLKVFFFTSFFKFDQMLVCTNIKTVRFINKYNSIS